MKSRVAHSLFDKRFEMLVVAVAAIKRQGVGPLSGQVTDR
jgi:hypothetical protein